MTIANLKFLIIETAFSNKERQLAEISRHLCPATLAEELAKLERNAEIYITHLKPGEIEPTMLEIEECRRSGAHAARSLVANSERQPGPARPALAPLAGLSRSVSPSSPRSRGSSAQRAAPIRSGVGR